MKRGQAAFEFLATYGWALSIVLIMIGAISYFGITDPSSLVSDRCTSPSGFNCNDFQISLNNDGDLQFNILIRHSLGYEIGLPDFSTIEDEVFLYNDYGAVFYGDLDTATCNFTMGTISSGGLNTFSGSCFIEGDSLNNMFEPGTLNRFNADIYYYRLSSGPGFRRPATFDIIGRLG